MTGWANVKLANALQLPMEEVRYAGDHAVLPVDTLVDDTPPRAPLQFDWRFLSVFGSV